MPEVKKFQASVYLIKPHGLEPSKKTKDFEPLEGRLESISCSDQTGFYQISLLLRKKTDFVIRPEERKELKIGKVLGQIRKNTPYGRRSFCLDSKDLPDETLVSYLQRKIKVRPNLIEILA
jgi:hypothetical protein